MYTWLEKLLEIITTYGFPLVCAAVFLVAVLLALRALWQEYRRLTRRHHDMLIETARMIEIASAKSEIACSTITIAIERLAVIHEKLDALIDAINELASNNEPTLQQ